MNVSGRHLDAAQHASLIDISSIFGTSGGFGTSPAYRAAKGAVRTVTKNAALHSRLTVSGSARSTRASSGRPSSSRPAAPEYCDAMTTLTQMAHLGQPEDVAAGVAYLASDYAKFVTGVRAVHRRRVHRPLTRLNATLITALPDGPVVSGRGAQLTSRVWRSQVSKPAHGFGSPTASSRVASAPLRHQGLGLTPFDGHRIKRLVPPC